MKKIGKKLILFDIDGTLIRSEGLTGTTVLIKKHFNLDASEINKKLYLEGKTYRAAFAEKLAALGIKDPEKHAKFEIAINDAEPLKYSIKSGKGKIEKIEGVEELLKQLIKKGYILGLLTGNSEEVSKAKLGAVDLWRYFLFGAWGTQTKIRGELVDMAISKAEKVTGIKFDKKYVFNIGDTVRDIECAKHGEIKIIAVATGKETFEQLKAENPDFLFKDFSDIDKIIRAIEK
jgi:phosphoglycolate phosphatase-like HAD superfamily hydrolase